MLYILDILDICIICMYIYMLCVIYTHPCINNISGCLADIEHMPGNCDG